MGAWASVPPQQWVRRSHKDGTPGQGRTGQESDQCPGGLQVSKAGRAMEMQSEALGTGSRIISSLSQV